MEYPYRSYDENAALIEKLEEVHKSFKANLGKMNKSKKWAVWQLQGALLGIAYRAIKYQQQSDMIGLITIERLSYEFLNQVNYFAHPNTSQTAIKIWWKVYNPARYPAKLEEIKYTGFKKRPHAQNRHRPLPNGIDFSIGKYNKESDNPSSLWMHPSFNLTRQLFRTDRNNGSYDLYEYKDALYHNDWANFIASRMVNNAAKSLHLGSYLFGEPISLHELGVEDD